MRVYTEFYIEETVAILKQIDMYQTCEIETMTAALKDIRENYGRLFILGVGGSSATASHACNDFRKLCDIEAYCMTDNVAELTARVNDTPDGWATWARDYLETSEINEYDGLLVFSVGGGTLQLSRCIGHAINYANEAGARTLAIVGRDGGKSAVSCDQCVIIPPLYPDRITPHTEGIAGVLLHLLVSHPLLTRP